MEIDFYDLRRLHGPLAEELQGASGRVISSGRYILDAELSQFEQAFAAYLGSDHCVGVGNGLDALYLALAALGIGPGDRVLVPANAFVAVALAVSRTGAVPVAADACPRSRNLDPGALPTRPDPAIRAVVAVHQYGAIADMAAITDWARRHGLFVVEDAAQAHGAREATRQAGTLGDVGCFSFYPTKNLGALGDGGAVVSRDGNLAERVRRLRNYGAQDRDAPKELGANSRLDEIQAALLRIKLPYLESWNRRRCEIAARYLGGLEGLPLLRLPEARLDGSSAWHLFVICHPRRDALRAALARRGVATAIHYPRAIHQMTPFSGIEVAGGRLPVAESLAATCLSLPMAPYLSDDEVEHVIAATREAAAEIPA